MPTSPHTRPARPAPRPSGAGRASSRPPRRGRLGRALGGDRPYVLALLALLVVLGAMAVGPLQAFTAAADRVDALEASRAALQEQVDALEERKERLNNLEEVELLARSELGLVKPGEVPFVVVRPERDVEQVGPEAAQEPAPADEWYRRLGRVLADWLR